jgi:hypothetical protein
MDHPARTLYQERAALGARQGDPESPASGTLYARRRRLAEELEAIEGDQTAMAEGGSAGLAVRYAGTSVMTRRRRSMSEVQRDLAVVDDEIGVLQERIDAIDRILGRMRTKN